MNLLNLSLETIAANSKPLRETNTKYSDKNRSETTVKIQKIRSSRLKQRNEEIGNCNQQ